MQRSKLRNIINRAKEISAKKDSPFESFKKSLPMDINDNYRLEAAWKAYGLPSNFQEAKFYGMIESLDGENYILPSIGYNEDTEEYEYLNKGKENETVAKDIRAWDNDVIPFIKELKLGGYVRLFNEEKDCWTYTKNSQKRELSAEDKGEQVIDSFLEGGNVQKKYTLPEMFLSRNINGISIKYSNPYLPNSFNSQKDVDDFISKYSKYSSWVINDPNSKYKNLRVQSGILRDGGSHEVNIYDDDDSEDLWNLGGIIEDNGVTSTENDKKLASERKTKLNDFLKPYGILFNNSSTQTFKQGGKTKNKESYYEFLKTLPPNLQKGNTDDGDGVEKDDGYRMELLFQNAPDVWTFEDGVKKGYFNLNEEDGLYHSGSIIEMPNGNYEFLKSSNHPTVGYETNWYKYHPSAKEFRQNYELVTTDDNGNPLKYYKYIKRTPQAFKQGGKSEYKKVKSDKAYYDKNSDTVYYTNDEDLIHEGFHARPDYVLLEQLKPYYENLNDEKILNFGGNLEFVKRLEGDPGHFYSPEELGARISAAKFRTEGNNYTPEFFKYLRTNENLYGDNMRDLLYMYNDENLSKIFNLGDTQAFKQGGQMNVIPEGALHARKNNMEGAGKDFTAKGIPVMSNDGELVAEIEKNEIVFNKKVTDFIEENYKKFYSDEVSNSEKDELAIKVGKRLVKEILENTDDRTGLIEEVANKNNLEYNK